MSFEEITQALAIKVSAETAEAKRAVDSLFTSFTSLAKVTEEAQKKSKAFGSALGGDLFQKSPMAIGKLTNEVKKLSPELEKTGGFFDKASKKWVSDITTLGLKVTGVGMAFKLLSGAITGALERSKFDPALAGLDALRRKTESWTRDWERATDRILEKIARHVTMFDRTSTGLGRIEEAGDTGARMRWEKKYGPGSYIDKLDPRTRFGFEPTEDSEEYQRMRGDAMLEASQHFGAKWRAENDANLRRQAQRDTLWSKAKEVWADQNNSGGWLGDEIRSPWLSDPVETGWGQLKLQGLLAEQRKRLKDREKAKRVAANATTGKAPWSDLASPLWGAADLPSRVWNTMNLYGGIADMKAGWAATENRNSTGLDFLLGGAAGGTEPNGFSTTAGQAQTEGIGSVLDKMLDKMNEVSQASQAFQSVLSAGLGAGIEALVSGHENAGKAALRASALVARGLSVEFGLRAMGAYAGGNIVSGIGYTAAAAAAGAASAGLMALAGGGGGGGAQLPGGGGYASGSSTAPGGGAPPGWGAPMGSGGGGDTFILQVGDGFVGKPNELAVAIEDRLRAGRRSGRIKSSPGAVTYR